MAAESVGKQKDAPLYPFFQQILQRKGEQLQLLPRQENWRSSSGICFAKKNRTNRMIRQK
jgi:hypothetical protein